MLVDAKVLPPPRGADQRWDLLMKPFAKVNSPQVPPWASAKLVLSPTTRPMPLAGPDEDEPSAKTLLNKYSYYANAHLVRASQELNGIQSLGRFAPMSYFVSAERLEGFEVAKRGLSLPVVSFVWVGIMSDRRR
jgi:hypothetical protein